MNPPTGNLYAELPPSTAAEEFRALWQTPGVRVERIVSRGHATPPGEWYDQDGDEWVVLLSGEARLRIAGRDELLELTPGDWVLLPARLRHRVEWTAPDRESVWLAVHVSAGG